MIALAAGGGVLCVAAFLRLASDQLAALPRGAYLAPSFQADAGVALGYVLNKDGTLTRALKARVEAAALLWQQDSVAWLVFSGGHPGGGLRRRSEAEAMAQYAHQLMKPAPGEELPPRWLLEQRSTSTRENAVLSLAMLQGRGLELRSLAIATNPFHQLRSLLTFKCAAKEAGMRDLQLLLAYVKPQSDSEEGSLLNAAWMHADVARELAALAYYWWMGYLC